MNYLHSSNPTGELELGATSQPWLVGDGLFETLKSESGQLFFLDRHLSRLRESAKELLFTDFDEDLLRRHIEELRARTAEVARGRFRITLFSNGEYLLSHVSAPLRIAPQKLIFSTKPRFSGSFLSARKSISYGEASFGLRVAANNGCDDLIYLNERNEVVETGTANLLLENKGSFITPSLDSGCLPGIVRGVFLDWFKEVREEVVTVEDLQSASGLYILSSLREMDLVTELHDRNGLVQKFQITAVADKLRSDYLINSRSVPNS